MPEVLEGCKRALFDIEKKEEMLLSQAADDVELNLKEEEEIRKIEKLQRNIIQAKGLAAKIKLLNKQLNSTLQQINHDIQGHDPNLVLPLPPFCNNSKKESLLIVNLIV